MPSSFALRNSNKDFLSDYSAFLLRVMIDYDHVHILGDFKIHVVLKTVGEGLS